MIRTNSRKKNIIKKCLVLLGAIAVLVGVVIYGHWQTNREHQSYEESLKEGTESVDLKSNTESVPESGTGDTPGEATSEMIYTANITNLDFYCTPVMGEDSMLLVQSLNYYLSQKGIVCDSGEIVQVQVPEDEPESVRYYVMLNDESSRIVILEYHTVENIVTCSSCNYSNEEIIGEPWSEAPAQTDISPEEEAAFLEQQAAAEGQEVAE